MSLCQVCDDRSGGEFVGVACIPGVPMSARWCRLCVEANAVPRGIADYHLERVGGDLRRLADWVLAQTVWWGGRYVPFREYVRIKGVKGE